MRTVTAIFLILIAVTLSRPAHASTVTNTADSGPGSLRQAIAIAVAGETIDFAVSGTITLTTGELLINTNLVIRGPGAGILMIQRSTVAGTPDFRIFNIQSGTVTISGLTVNNGRAAVGGGIHNAATFTLRDSVVIGNAATERGGGINNLFTMALTNCAINGNFAAGGGGINNEGNFTLRDCVVIGNAATERGGGINNLFTMTMSNCVIHGNAVSGGLGSGFGGGINNANSITATTCAISSNSVVGVAGTGGFGGGINNDASVALTNCAINGNFAAASGGGINNEGSLTLHTATISANAAKGGNGGRGHGGGIASGFGMLGFGSVTLDRCTVSSNSVGIGAIDSGQGGGIASIGSLYVTNSTISGNIATGDFQPPEGGGIFSSSRNGNVTLNHSTVVSNVVSGLTPQEGGGLFNSAGSVVDIKNTIVAANIATSDVFNGQMGETISDGFNLIGTNSPFIPGPNDRFNITAVELKIGPLQNNGGLTFTHALLCGSPAIDAGDNTNAPATDQRGFLRIVNGIIDIGAYESSNSPLPSCTIDGPAPVCPHSTNSYSSTATGGVSHNWSITGSGTILGSVTGSSVPVLAGGVGIFILVDTVALDGCSNTCVKMVSVQDTNKPSINCSANKTNECGVGNLTFDTPTASDECGAVTISVLGTVTNLGCGNTFVATRTWVATDSSGNTNTCTQTITVNDTNPPSITCPTNLTVSCASQVPAPNTNSVTTSDTCGGAVTVSWQGDSINSSNCAGQFVITRIYRAADSCGNSATCTQTITINDTNPPSITCPTNLTVSCATQVPAPNTNSVTTSDTCGGAVTVSWQGDAISSSNCVGQFNISRTYRATDQCGNSATCTQTITINDTNPPSITCPTNLTMSCASQVPAPNTNSVTTSDNCGGAVTVSWQGDSISSSNCAGFVISRTYRATDQCGNSATCTQTITVNDTNPPSITCPTNLTMSCASQVPAPNTNSVTTSDTCGGAVTVSWQGDSISSSNCIGQFNISRTYRATDQCGNSATCTQTITINDTNPPSISCSANKTNRCGVSGLTFDTPTASDSCGSTTISVLNTVTNLTSDGSFVATRTWVATDLCGNTNSCSQTIVAVNRTAPTITCPSPITVNSASATGAVVTVSVNVADADGDPLIVVWTVDGAPYQTNAVPAGGPPTVARVDLTVTLSIGSHQITVSVFDTGCEATCSTTVTVAGSGCGDLYPIALHNQSLVGVPVGGVIADIYNGIQPGNFGWLTWAGSPNEPTIMKSLTPPGNSSTYINPQDPKDHVVSVGDWVQGKPGISNSRQVRRALDKLKAIDIVVPVWDRAISRGNNSLYRVVAFARVRIIDYQLPNQNRITARFLGLVTCD